MYIYIRLEFTGMPHCTKTFVSDEGKFPETSTQNNTRNILTEFKFIDEKLNACYCD